MNVKKRVDEAIEKYGSGMLTQSGIGSASAILGVLFPPLGVASAAAQAALTARAGRLQQERIDQAVEDITLRLERIEHDKIDDQFVESDWFLEWLQESFDRIRRTQDEAKRAALRNVFLNGVLLGQSAGAIKEIVLRRIGEMSAYHVHAISALERGARLEANRTEAESLAAGGPCWRETLYDQTGVSECLVAVVGRRVQRCRQRPNDDGRGR